MSARRGAAEPGRALHDPQIRDLYVRLLRGRPQTTADIRAVAPGHPDLSAALEALESDGLIAVGREGLIVHDPREVVPDIVRDELMRRESIWDGMAAASAELLQIARAWREPTRPGTAVPGTVTVGAAVTWWDAALSLPDLGGIAAPDVDVLLQWQRDGTLASRIAAVPCLLVPANVVADAAARAVLDDVEAAGVQVRVSRIVPGWLATGAGVALALRWSVRAPTGVLRTGEPSIVAALSWMFERGWSRGVPLAGIDVFVLLAWGCDDTEAAATLGVSVRTVQRRIGDAMDAVGARSRFELGLAWARTPEVITATAREA